MLIFMNFKFPEKYLCVIFTFRDTFAKFKKIIAYTVTFKDDGGKFKNKEIC